MCLHIPSGRNARWDLLKSLIHHWFGQLTDSDKLSSQELEKGNRHIANLVDKVSLPGPVCGLPTALREWYQMFGNAKRIWSSNDHFLSPTNITLSGNTAVFYVENQAVVEWGIRVEDLALPDPPVVLLDRGAGVIEEGLALVINDSVSQFALQMFLHNVKSSTALFSRSSGPGTAAAHIAIASTYSKCGLPSWPFPPCTLFSNSDILIEAEGFDDGDWIMIAARTESAFTQFQRIVSTSGISWKDWSTSFSPWL
jgi:hypothetical protein